MAERMEEKIIGYNVKIRRVCNGYEVAPYGPEHEMIQNSDIMVFESFEGLAKYLKQFFTEAKEEGGSG